MLVRSRLNKWVASISKSESWNLQEAVLMWDVVAIPNELCARLADGLFPGWLSLCVALVLSSAMWFGNGRSWDRLRKCSQISTSTSTNRLLIAVHVDPLISNYGKWGQLVDWRWVFLNLVIILHVNPFVTKWGDGKRVWNPEFVSLWGASPCVKTRMLRDSMSGDRLWYCNDVSTNHWHPLTPHHCPYQSIGLQGQRMREVAAVEETASHFHHQSPCLSMFWQWRQRWGSLRSMGVQILDQWLCELIWRVRVNWMEG